MAGKNMSKAFTEYFDAGIYSHSVLKRTARAFSEFANIEIKREGKYRKVVFKSVHSEHRSIIADEFANYALGCLVVET